MCYGFGIRRLLKKRASYWKKEQGREGRRNEEWEKGKRKRERDLVAQYILRLKKMYTNITHDELESMSDSVDRKSTRLNSSHAQ